MDIALLFLSHPPTLGLLLVGIVVVIAYNLATLVVFRSNGYLDMDRCDKKSNLLDIALLSLSHPPPLMLSLVCVDLVIAYNLATL
jgi:hypothetical protein